MPAYSRWFKLFDVEQGNVRQQSEGVQASATPALVLLYVIVALSSRVEALLWTQVAYDTIEDGAALARHDHIVFPSDVPGSFLGPAVMRCDRILFNLKSLAGPANAIIIPAKLTQRKLWMHCACSDVVTARQIHDLFWDSRK
ncbi:alpha-1,6- mannosyltransferase, partial [Tilletia horrida]